MWTLKGLIEYVNGSQTEIDGKWVPMRPLSDYGLHRLCQRISAAWAVLRGKADAFTWPGGQ